MLPMVYQLRLYYKFAYFPGWVGGCVHVTIRVLLLHPCLEEKGAKPGPEDKQILVKIHIHQTHFKEITREVLAPPK